MSLTINQLIPDVYAALDVVSRELVGAIPGVTRDAAADRLATDQTLRIAQSPALDAGTYTPAMAVPSAINRTITNAPLTLTKNRFAGFSITGEQEYALNQGPGFNPILQGMIQQAFRTLVNEMESDVTGALAQNASRAFGTSGQTPFASTLGDSAQVKRILDDNGAPMASRSLVVDTTAGANLRTLGNIVRVNEAGTAATLRDGELLNLHGFSVRESAQINRATAGTGSGITTSANLARGATTITTTGGSGTILAGDIVTIDSVKYVVRTALSGGSFTISAPGLVAAVNSGASITVNATCARNLAFTQDALVLATRLPAFPSVGDLAVDSQVVTDPRTGISFDLRAYAGDGMVLYRVHALWGWVVQKPQHVAILQG